MHAKNKSTDQNVNFHILISIKEFSESVKVNYVANMNVQTCSIIVLQLSHTFLNVNWLKPSRHIYLTVRLIYYYQFFAFKCVFHIGWHYLKKRKWVWPGNTTHHKPQTNLWHRDGEPHNNHKTPGRQTKQSNQLSLPHQDDCKTRMDIK